MSARGARGHPIPISRLRSSHVGRGEHEAAHLSPADTGRLDAGVVEVQGHVGVLAPEGLLPDR